MNDRIPSDKKLFIHPRLLFSVLLFTIIFCISTISIINNKQLGVANGVAEEYFLLGWNLHNTGSFFPNDDNIPFVFRPPGYSFFLSTVLKIGGIPKIGQDYRKVRTSGGIVNASLFTIFIIQCMLLSFSCVFLFLLLSKFLRIGGAFILSFLFGCNPHTLILTGFISYGILHLFLTILSIYILMICLDKVAQKTYITFFAGVFWGLTTLVRPMTLILPPFIFIILLIMYKNQWRLALKAIAAFTIGMVLIICPYTIRNYNLTKRLIVVNAQGSMVIWASTVAKLPPISGNKRWSIIHSKYGMPIFQKITNYPEYNYYQFIKHNLELNDEHKKQTFENLLRQPHVYLYNILNNFVYFNIGYTSTYVDMFLNSKHINNKKMSENKTYSHIQNILSKTFEYYMTLLMLLNFSGLILAIKNIVFVKKNTIFNINSTDFIDSRSSCLVVPILIYFCFCFAHSISYMDFMYYYIKLPFLFIFIGYLIRFMDNRHLYLPLFGKISLSFLLKSILITFGLGITISIIFV